MCRFLLCFAGIPELHGGVIRILMVKRKYNAAAAVRITQAILNVVQLIQDVKPHTKVACFLLLPAGAADSCPLGASDSLSTIRPDSDRCGLNRNHRIQANKRG